MLLSALIRASSPRHVLVLAMTLCLMLPGAARCETFVEIATNQSYEPGHEMDPFDIQITVHPDGDTLYAASMSFRFNYSSGNIIGSLGAYPEGDAQVFASNRARLAFESISINTFGPGNDPDSLMMGVIDFGGPSWMGSGELFRIHVIPTGTGSLNIDTAFIPPASGGISFIISGGVLIPTIINPTINIPPQPETIRYRIRTGTATDPIIGNTITIYFELDASGHEIFGLLFGHKWSFSNGNIIGPHSVDSGQVEIASGLSDVFESISYGPTNGGMIDTSFIGATDFDGEGFTGDEVIWSLTFTPTDTGTIYIDTTTIPPGCCPLGVLGDHGIQLPINFIPATIVVTPCPYDKMGDVNQDQVLNSADLIYFVNYIFKSGPDPLPDRSIGDVNCTGCLGASDIIYLVGHIFKGGPEPCVCIKRRI